jgi:hypothetical protein
VITTWPVARVEAWLAARRGPRSSEVIV